MATNPAEIRPPGGGGFLLEPVGSRRIRTLEDLDETQRALRRTAERFATDRVLANADRIEEKDPKLLRRLLREAGELGLLGAEIPEEHGGLGLDAVSSLLLTEAMAKSGSWAVTWGVQTGVGTLPIVWFGTEAQKSSWLPRLARGETVAAYALSEAGSGSDALAARTRAVLSPDESHYLLDGSKQWITNAALADLFVVFAKVDGERFSAFLVERDAPGFAVGKEERKMGLRGSSTCPLSFDGARVPAANLLGEEGMGHRIAFNVLNLGRLKLGGGCVAGARNVLQIAVQYARERRAFGQVIAHFGLVREKLARMASLAYVGEAMTHRIAGAIDERVAASRAAGAGLAAAQVAAAEEFAAEASIAKVWGSEALGWVADEALQIHGGYGFVEEYAVERIFRDQRVNRIFEGTNEINRMLVPGTLLRRAMKGVFPYLELAQAVSGAIARGERPRRPPGPLAREMRIAELNKQMAVHAMAAAVEVLGPAIAERQEVLGALADALIEAYAVDSSVARALQAPRGPHPVAEACVGLYALEAHARAHLACVRAIRAAVTDPADCRTRLAGLRTLLDEEPADLVGLRERIVEATLEKGRYPLAVE